MTDEPVLSHAQPPGSDSPDPIPRQDSPGSAEAAWGAFLQTDEAKQWLDRQVKDAIARAARSDREAYKRDMLSVFSPLLGIAEAIQKHALALGIIAYALGFVIAVMHFQKRGVPLNALGNSQFVGAALLFAGLTVLPALEGRHLARGSTPWALFGLSTTALALWMWFSSWGAAPGMLVVYWLIVAVVALGVHRRDRRSGEGGRQLPPDATPWNAVILPTFSLLAVLFAFGGNVYPNTPQWLGGGQARKVAIEWADDDRTSDLMGGVDYCTQTYEVFEDDHWLYLSIARMPRPADGCSHAFSSRALTWFGLQPQTTSIVVPRSATARIVYNPTTDLEPQQLAP